MAGSPNIKYECVDHPGAGIVPVESTEFGVIMRCSVCSKEQARVSDEGVTNESDSPAHTSATGDGEHDASHDSGDGSRNPFGGGDTEPGHGGHPGSNRATDDGNEHDSGHAANP